MNSLVKKGLYCGLFVAGLTLLGTTAAQASETTGEDSLLGGGIIDALVELPVSVVDNAISVIGDSTVTSAPPAPAVPEQTAPFEQPAAQAATPATSGEDSVLGGTQALVDAVVPISVTGNAITLIGDSSSTGAGAPLPAPAGPQTSAGTNGDDSILGGNQLLADVLAPITVTGNAITLIGDSSSTGPMANTPASGEANSDPVTSGLDGLLGGNQLLVGLGLPVTVSGNAITVIGDSTTTTPGGPGGPTDPTDPTDPADPTSPTEPPTPGTPTTSGLANQAAAVSSSGLASTGVDATILIGGCAALMLLGLALLVIARHRTN